MASERGTFKRSSVTKIPIAELTRTTHALPKGEDQYEAQTYLSPAGRTIAKVMICGTAIEKEDVGKDSSHWRVRISDPSGTVQVYADMYQPEAAAVIAQLEIPCFVAVVGKLHIYEPESGSHRVSIRPDSVTIIDIDGKARDDFILDASLSLIRSVRKTDDETMKRVADIYGEKDAKETYIFVARQAIESLLPDHGVGDHSNDKEMNLKNENDDKAGEAKEQSNAPTSEPQASLSSSIDSIDSGIKTVQEVVLDILKEKGTVKYEALPELLKAKGVNPNMADWTSAVKRLMDEGHCYESKIGILNYVASNVRK